MSEQEEQTDLLQTLDDACIFAVLQHLNAKQLSSVLAVCSRIRNVATNNKLWIKHIMSDFGLLVATDAKAADDTPAAAYAAAHQLYKSLRAAAGRPHALQAHAISTDGGCDEPYEAYWADNLFTYKGTVMYCSEADTRNINIFARLCPRRSHGSESHCWTPTQIAGSDLQPLTVDQASVMEEKRTFIQKRCVWAAKHIISQHAAALRLQQRQQQQQGHNSSVHGSVLSRLLQRLHRLGTAADDAMTAAEEALSTCSPEGIADFFMAIYMMGDQQFGQQHSSAAQLFQALFSGLNDAGIHKVHEVAFELWGDIMDGRAEHKYVTLPLPQLVPHPAGLCAGAFAGGGVGGGQARARQLLCAEDQLQALACTTAPEHNTCIVEEIILSRDGPSDSTCPISSGFVFLGQYQQHCSSSTAGQQVTSAVAATDGAANAADTSGASISHAANAAAAALGRLTKQPWLTAADNLTTASAVFTAAGAGLLPPVADYASNGTAEWIEFMLPTQQQLQDQQNDWARLAMGGADGSSSSSSSSAAGACGAGFLAPVLWFRFFASAALDDEDGNAGALVHESEDELDTEAEGVDAEDGSSSAAFDEAPSGEAAAPAEGASVGDPSAPAVGTTSAAMAQRQQQQQQQQEEEEPQPQEQHAPGTTAAAAAGQQQPAAGCSAAAAAAAASSSGPAGDTAAPAAAAAVPAPRTAPPVAVCGTAPGLPASATEVAAALGYLPGPQHTGMLAVQLHTPRAANLVCVKLLECEDRKPEFNRSRGGCNIDMQLLMLRGFELGELPGGLTIATAAGNGQSSTSV